MNNCTIITVCSRVPTEPYYCLREFVRSVGDNILYVLGSQPNQYKGLGDKPKFLYSAIKAGEIKTKYIIFCDCFDLVFAVSPQVLFDEYLLFNKPLVISAERNCFPSDLKDEYDKLNNNGSSYKYLNSGMIVGETEAMLTVLEAMDLKNVPADYRMDDGQMCHINDQFLYQQIFLKQPVEIALDRQQVLCNTLHNVYVEELEFDEIGIKNKETHNYPCSFHANGSAKTSGILPPILKHLKLI